MKKLMVSAMLLTSVAALVFMLGVYKRQTEQVFDQAIYAKNATRVAISLYPENPKLTRPLGTLKPGDALPLKYLGVSGAWYYLESAGITVSVRDAELVTGYLYMGRWFVSQDLVAYLNYPSDFIILSSIGLLMTALVLLALLFRMKIEANRIRLYEKERLAFRRHAMQASEKQKLLEVKVRNLQTSLIHEKKERASEISQAHRVSLSEKERLNLQQKLKQQIAHKQSLEDEVHTIKSQLKIEKQKRELELEQRDKWYKEKLRLLEQAFEKESQIRINATVSAMESSYDKLQSKYDQFITEVADFDVPVASDNYYNILKGRRFELYIACRMVNEKGCDIIEWTPDKGFVAGLKVEANSNPDLVLKQADGQTIAIECKYRSKIESMRKFPDAVIWCSYGQMKCYERFAEERKIPVFVALGIGGDARGPDSVYMAGFKEMNNLSDYGEYSKKEYIEGEITATTMKFKYCHKKHLAQWRESAESEIIT